ncbi:MAG: DinB family protein [Chloroflexota bacterium]|nr:DinB family protein [Chloroflexota bacterium]
MTDRATSNIDLLVHLLDHTLEESASEFGWDHWHSLIRNLSTVEPGEWDALPAGAGRTIRQIVRHIGVTYLMHENHAFGDGKRGWGDLDVDGIEPGESPDELTIWLRATHGRFRDSVANLTDDVLDNRRPAAWGDLLEVRRIVELMIQHPLYHVGEINHIRALLQGNDDWDHQDMGREEPEA